LTTNGLIPHHASHITNHADLEAFGTVWQAATLSDIPAATTFKCTIPWIMLTA